MYPTSIKSQANNSIVLEHNNYVAMAHHVSNTSGRSHVHTKSASRVYFEEDEDNKKIATYAIRFLVQYYFLFHTIKH